jgi:flagellar hook protein FlgE
MLTAFSTALSALNANEVGVNVVGNNLANLNTSGFKASVASFSDLMSQQLSGDGSQVGMGTGQAHVTRQYAQGTIQPTSGPLDAAIQGDGFFVVNDASGQVSYTRDGGFHVDASGNLVTATGQKVQGWCATAGKKIDTSGATGDIIIPGRTLTEPSPTKGLSFDLNLDAEAKEGSTFSTPIQVVDSLGATHVLTMTFTKGTAPNTWDYKVSIPGEDLTAGTPKTPFALSAAGTLTFDTSGKLLTPNFAAGKIAVAVPGLKNGAADLSIAWSLYNDDQSSRVSQFAADSSASSPKQDGVTAGQLTGIAMADGGKLVASYSNGETAVVAQLGIASIGNPESLMAMGNNLFQLGVGSAIPSVGAAGAGGRGKVVGGALEASTVDIAREFTNLIVYQRSYQANARVITTADQLGQEVVNLKR